MHTLLQFRSADEPLSRDPLEDDTSWDVQKKKGVIQLALRLCCYEMVQSRREKKYLEIVYLFYRSGKPAAITVNLVAVTFHFASWFTRLQHKLTIRNTVMYSIMRRSQWLCGLRRRPRSLGNWNRGFKYRLRHGCLSSSFCVVLSCRGRAFAMDWSLVRSSPSVCLNRLRNLQCVRQSRSFQGL
jgi:hypothetical protein